MEETCNYSSYYDSVNINWFDYFLELVYREIHDFQAKKGEEAMQTSWWMNGYTRDILCKITSPFLAKVDRLSVQWFAA